MAGPRTLDPDRLSLRELVDECLYTAVRIRQSPIAKAQLPLAESLLAEARAGLAVEEKLSERLIEADAGVMLRNLDLDAAVAEHRGVIARLTRGKTEHALYQRFYGGMSPHAVIRLGLRNELSVVEPWIDSLKRDPDPSLSALATPLAQAVKDGREACAAQDQAIWALRDFRADKRLKLFDSICAGRLSVWAELTKLGLGTDFVASFFRSAPRRRRNELTLVEAEDALRSAESQLKDAQAELAAAKSRADLATAAELSRREAQLAEAEAEARQIATLRKQAA